MALGDGFKKYGNMAPSSPSQQQDIELDGQPIEERPLPVSYENGGQVIEEEDDSLIAKALNFMDNLTPDDMGGALRGESGWLEDTLVGNIYEQTAGRVVGAHLSAGESVFNGIAWFSSKASMLSAAAVSVMPGGIETLTWDEAHEVSLGQAFTGSMAIEAGKIERGDADFATLAMLPFSLISLTAAQIDTDNAAQDAGWNIKEKADRLAAFDDGAGMWVSGSLDAGIMVATDPTILLGGAGTFVRTGIKAGTKAATSGLTKARITNQYSVARHSANNTEAAELIQSQPGKTFNEKLANARKTSAWKKNPDGEHLVYAMQNNGASLAGSIYVKGDNASRAKTITGFLDDISTSDPLLAADVVNVLMGDVSSWGKVYARDVDIYERLASANDINALQGVRLADGSYPAPTEAMTKLGDDLVEDAQGYQDFVVRNREALDEAREIERVTLLDDNMTLEAARNPNLLNDWRNQAIPEAHAGGSTPKAMDDAVKMNDEFFNSKFNPLRDSASVKSSANVAAKENPALNWMDETPADTLNGESGFQDPSRWTSTSSGTFVKNGTLSRKEVQEIAEELGSEGWMTWANTGRTPESFARGSNDFGSIGRLRDGSGETIKGWAGVPEEWTFGAGKSATRISIPFAKGGVKGRTVPYRDRVANALDEADSHTRPEFDEALKAGQLDDALDAFMMNERALERPRFMPKGTQVPAGYDEATEVISRVHMRRDAASLNLIQQGGNQLSSKAAYYANAWRLGKANSNVSGTIRGRNARTSFVEEAKAGGFVTTAIQRTSGSRTINVVRWAGKGSAPGVIMLKGMDGERGNRQVGNWLRKSGMNEKQSTSLFNEFIAASSEGEKALVLAKMEIEAIVAEGLRGGISRQASIRIAEGYAKARSMELAKARKTKTLYAVDENGAQIVLPSYLREVNGAVPMIDMKRMKHVLMQNKDALAQWTPKSVARNLAGKKGQVQDSVVDVLDEINSLWKVSVLLRLGYTQRNLGEGFLRSMATQSFAAIHLKELANSLPNAYYRTGEISFTLAAKRSRKHLTRVQKQLENSQADLLKMGARSKAQRVDKTSKKTEIDELLDEVNRLKIEIDGYVVASLERKGKRKLGGASANELVHPVTGEKIKLEGSFQGAEAELHRALSSSDSTTRRTLEAGMRQEVDRVKGGHDFVPMDPDGLSSFEMSAYWDEFALRLNDKYLGDVFAERLLAVKPDGSPRFTRQDHIDWVNSGEGHTYFKAVNGGRFVDESTASARIGFVDDAIARMDYEVPVGVPRSLFAKNSSSGHRITSLEVEKSMEGLTLPTIPGRKVSIDGVTVSDILTSPTAMYGKGKDALSFVMKALGTWPETKLLRHPYYNNVYKKRQAELFNLAAQQGQDVGSATVKAQINKGAHSDALHQTNDMMYTILEMSNAADSVRFLSPFFASYENSIRTWAKIGYNRPYVVGIADKMFNVPNNMGLVYDENGEQVEHSNIFKDNETFVVFPDEVNDFLEDAGIGSGQPMKFRQQGMNFVFPGKQAWWPGLGPMTAVPTALFLRGKPQVQEIMKQNMGDDFYREIVPFGDANSNLAEYMMPTWARKLKQMVGGTDSTDDAYVSLKVQMTQDAYIAAQLQDRKLGDADFERIEKEANDFWSFQVGAALVMPWQSQRESPYALQRNGWRKLIEDDTLPYDVKVERFVEKYGTEFLAVTRSRKDNFTGADATLKTFTNLKDNSKFVNELELINPRLVGLFANLGSEDAPYSQAVSQEFDKFEVNGRAMKQNLSAAEIVRKNEIADGWREWTENKDMIEGRLRELGLSSVNLKAPASQHLKLIQEDKRAELAERFPAWGIQQETFTSQLGDTVNGLRMIAENDKFIKDQPKTVNAIQAYLNLREEVRAALQFATSDSDREYIRESAMAKATQIRDSSIAFSDLFDLYLEDKDDFREVSYSG